jgi:hypothetical protein
MAEALYKANQGPESSAQGPAREARDEASDVKDGEVIEDEFAGAR